MSPGTMPNPPVTPLQPGFNASFSALSPARKISGLSEHAPQWDHRGGQARRSRNSQRRSKLAAVSGPACFLEVELAKGFEPPTL